MHFRRRSYNRPRTESDPRNVIRQRRFSYLIFPDINGTFGHTSRGDWLDQQSRSTNIVLIVNGESGFVLGQHNVLRSTASCQRRSHRTILSQADLTTGNPVTLDSLNVVYHTGNKLYRNLRVSRTIDLYGSANKYGSRLLVSMCAWARKKGENAPTKYHLVNISGSGFPKNPPTSAAITLSVSNSKHREITNLQRSSFQRCYWREPWGHRQPYVPTCPCCLQSTWLHTSGHQHRRNG